MFNKSMIDKMLDMPDDRLLAMLRMLLGSSGIDMGDKKIDEKTIRRIRALLSNITDADIERVTYLVDVYKHGG